MRRTSFRALAFAVHFAQLDHREKADTSTSLGLGVVSFNAVWFWE